MQVTSLPLCTSVTPESPAGWFTGVAQPEAAITASPKAGIMAINCLVRRATASLLVTVADE
ncbi:hypothetical protein Lesp01_20180 [Lentzea sp. NBRC 102530]|nr:hypothetical protein Lesp01_20180 [Lentzea sp. NBRC 102530]